ncbi:MAG TPA: VOC family protein [Blastocatellia bacterium]|nr:VOC family protein [Blastocatellia bacterium]
MANGSLIEQLDQAVEAILANPEAPLPRASARIAAELSIAVELRNLPRADFKARLRSDLERTTGMTAQAPTKFREGFHTITPYLVVNDAVGVIDFIKQAFGAQEMFRTGTAGGWHAEVKIGDSMVMLGGSGGTPNPTSIHLYVKDADAVYESALQAGGVSLHGPVDQPYGDREASVEDPAGNQWYIATHKATGHVPEGLRTVTPFLHPIGAPQMIDFLKRAFGAEELSRAESPDGVVHHATVKIGDSMVEMGEAHGPWQPMPTTFYLYVDDVDAWYRRALEAGATSRAEPTDQAYGDRVGGVADPFDNVWYLGSPIKGA